MTQTNYYGFNKPEGTDLVNPLVDTNPNWDALDADLHEFNERSIANCTEVVSLGVHTISRLDTTAKFLKWIATANFTAGETFTVDGLPVVASTPAGATLATNAYVTGSVVLACLNADNTAMTIYVSGTTVASDSERLGGELPAYYAKASDVSDNTTDITNLQNQVGNTSLVGIGDGTCTGAIDTLNSNLGNLAFRIYNGNAEFSIDGGSTWTQLGGGDMPLLDYANPLHRFIDTLTYTADKDCYLVGCFSRGSSDGSFTISIDNEIVCHAIPTGSTSFVKLKIANGQTVTLSGGNTAQRTGLNIYQAL